jgi:lysophospholipase L1-like esterase
MALKYLPDLRYLPEGLPRVDANTSLNSGIALGNFLKGVTLDHIPEVKDRIQIARNLLPQAQILKAIGEDSKRFSRHKLVVIEGLYKADPQEQITELEENTNFLATTGRSVVYELRRNNSIDNEKTFELARFLQTYHRTYDKLILDYDTYNQGELNVQIIIEMPKIPADYDIKFKGVVETRFNNKIQAVNQLIEITETPSTAIQFPADLPDEVTGYFTIGDVHARNLKVFGGDPWQTFARDARTSRDQDIIKNIQLIKEGEVVVISAGVNDAISSNDTPTQIAERVFKIVNTSYQLDHSVTFLLFKVTDKTTTTRQAAIRQAIINELDVLTNIRIVDLNDSQYSFASDGVSLSKESYISISNILI